MYDYLEDEGIFMSDGDLDDESQPSTFRLSECDDEAIEPTDRDEDEEFLLPIPPPLPSSSSSSSSS